ncbi:MAG: MCE family protein, partial [Betaproteobacteria bacterium]
MTGDEIPKARVRRRRIFRLIWMVLVMAIAVAAYLVFYRLQDYGPQITVTFRDGGGLRVGQTPLRYRGVQVGEVSGVSLSKDEKSALVRIRLIRSAEGVAREGSQFWIVRPRVGFGQITGLATVLSGPEVQVIPGKPDAKEQREFSGLENPPSTIEGGLRIVLRAARPKMRVDAPVYYRGVEVGMVQKLDLSPNSLSAD